MAILLTTTPKSLPDRGGYRLASGSRELRSYSSYTAIDFDAVILEICSAERGDFVVERPENRLI